MYLFVVLVLQDLKDSVSKIAQFLNKPLDSEVVEGIAERCVFKNMKQNKMSNYSMVPPEFMDQSKSEFLRKGKFQRIDHSLLTVLLHISTLTTMQLVTFSNQIREQGSFVTYFISFYVFQESLETGKTS